MYKIWLNVGVSTFQKLLETLPKINLNKLIVH